MAKLTKGFGVETLKSIFPYFFVNENNLNYIGEVPDIKYFNKLKLKDFNEYKNKFDNNWSLRDETIKYCEIDCISLHQVIFKFTEMIFDLFGKNVHNYPTLPSLAFAIFRSNFMEETQFLNYQVKYLQILDKDILEEQLICIFLIIKKVLK